MSSPAYEILATNVEAFASLGYRPNNAALSDLGTNWYTSRRLERNHDLRATKRNSALPNISRKMRVRIMSSTYLSCRG